MRQQWIITTVLLAWGCLLAGCAGPANVLVVEDAWRVYRAGETLCVPTNVVYMGRKQTTFHLIAHDHQDYLLGGLKLDSGVEE